MDVDSDNDGIFDLFEARHNLPDTDLNGIVDNANNRTGDNGLVDDLETSPDSFILNFVVANTDSDNFIDATEIDSDNDLCFDVIEAGFTDPDNDGILDTSPVQVDDYGKVINASDGYTIPNLDYINFAPILINTPFVDVEFCEDSNPSIFIDTTADSFQWQVSIDGITWSDLSNNANYSGITSNTLQISNLPLSFHNYQYRVFLSRNGNSCSDYSNSIT